MKIPTSRRRNGRGEKRVEGWKRRYLEARYRGAGVTFWIPRDRTRREAIFAGAIVIERIRRIGFKPDTCDCYPCCIPPAGIPKSIAKRCITLQLVRGARWRLSGTRVARAQKKKRKEKKREKERRAASRSAARKDFPRNAAIDDGKFRRRRERLKFGRAARDNAGSSAGWNAAERIIIVMLLHSLREKENK